MGTGQELYKKAKAIIPGGTQLLSKRPEMFLPEGWPAYYSRAKGCRVWDLDQREYLDMSYMGVGANVLGYAFDPVDDAARKAIADGGMCTLNAPEEVELAELLLELHPWAGMVRYTKAGGEAMAVAVRIARAHTRRDIVLVCGYHGWQDWYLSANLEDTSSLNAHHLQGLEPNGVPRSLAGTNLPFRYNNLEEFQRLVMQHRGNIAAVVMEPVRSDYPARGFLEIVRDTADREGFVVIYDEITAGFRIACGGSHLRLGTPPDIAVFAKAMSNGYPLCAIIGRSGVMNSAQSSFISSTFWTERVGLAAALASVRYFRDNKVEAHLQEMGELVQRGWAEKAKACGLPLHVSGIAPLGHFDVLLPEPLAWKTYFVQEMLERGYLCSNALYLSLAHTRELLEVYLEHCGGVFAQMAEVHQTGGDIVEKLRGPVCHSGFQRLN